VAGGESVNRKVQVTPTADGAVLSVAGYDIVITVKPSEGAVPTSTLDSVRSRLGEHLEELEVTESAEGIVVKPKGFLGRDKFALVAAIIEELGGRYVSAGRDSHFLIPTE
jgi:hypothetical protein